jgi:hypothetical protein
VPVRTQTLTRRLVTGIVRDGGAPVRLRSTPAHRGGFGRTLIMRRSRRTWVVGAALFVLFFGAFAGLIALQGELCPRWNASPSPRTS